MINTNYVFTTVKINFAFWHCFTIFFKLSIFCNNKIIMNIQFCCNYNYIDCQIIVNQIFRYKFDLKNVGQRPIVFTF